MGLKGEQTKDLIKNRAYQLFAKKGFKNVTMKDICDSTGLSRGGLYRHYDSTNQIFFDILAGFITGQREEFNEKIKLGYSCVQILEEALIKIKTELMDSENSLSIAIYEFCSLRLDNTYEEYYKQALATWSNFIRYGIERGEFAKVDVTSTANMILFAYEGVRMCSKVMGVDEAMADGIINQIRNILEVDYERR